MNIGIIGLGYVGLITGVGFASLGNKVVGVDIDNNKINKINTGETPIYEQGLEEKLKEVKENFKATTNINDLKDSEIIFVCVGTPSKEDGSIDLKYVRRAAEDISKILGSYRVIVIKSTVIPGTTESLIKILEKNDKKVGEDFGLGMDPEFLKEGNALKDFLEPDRIVIGSYDEKSKEILAELYKDLNCPKLFANIKTAEMIKYASNSFLATKISLINEIGNICKKLGIDVYAIAEGIGYDKRIGREFLNAGIGFGGSCFPKDIKALIAKSNEIGHEPKLLQEIIKINEKQPLKKIEFLKKHIPNLKGKEIGILGLAFKPETDDVRESRAIPIVKELLKEEVIIKAYDPKAIGNFKKLFPQIKYCSPEEILNSEAILILTNWKEFENLDYRKNIVIDGRGILKAKEAKIYEGICW